MSNGKKHSIVSPSSAARWLACPPSALLAEKAGKDKGSVYADEGTLAHRMAELFLRDFLNGRDWLAGKPNGAIYVPKKENPKVAAEFEKAKADPLFYGEMIDELRVYTDHVIGLLDAAGKGAMMHVEAEYPLFYKPDDVGTIDNAIFGGKDNTLYVTDLKFGRGVLVDAKNNKQLLIYAISAYDQLHPHHKIERVVMTIVQPRRNSITSWALDVADLEMERDMIAAIARKALNGAGKFKTGSHCMFCPVKPRCRALKDAASMAEKQFEDPALLTDDEIATLLGTIDPIADWISSVKKYALERAVEGVRFEGYKLVAGTSRRQIADEKAMFAALVGAGYEGSLLKRSSFITITELQRVVAKDDFEVCCAPYIVKPDAPPVLVEATDPRTEYGIAKAVEDFADYVNAKS